jgi:hypothetical protein
MRKLLWCVVSVLIMCFSCATAKVDTVSDEKLEEPKDNEEKKEKEKPIPPWVKHPRERPSLLD